MEKQRMTIEEFEEFKRQLSKYDITDLIILADHISTGVIETDNYGQLLIYTGHKRKSDPTEDDPYNCIFVPMEDSDFEEEDEDESL